MTKSNLRIQTTSSRDLSMWPSSARPRKFSTGFNSKNKHATKLSIRPSKPTIPTGSLMEAARQSLNRHRLITKTTRINHLQSRPKKERAHKTLRRKLLPVQVRLANKNSKQHPSSSHKLGKASIWTPGTLGSATITTLSTELKHHRDLKVIKTLAHLNSSSQFQREKFLSWLANWGTNQAHQILKSSTTSRLVYLQQRKLSPTI